MTAPQKPSSWPEPQRGIAWIPAPPILSDPLAWRAMKQAAVAISRMVDWHAQAEHPSYAELTRRRALLITPIYCQGDHCHAVVSVPHPLPADLLAIRCGYHKRQATAA
jgi:hypothetical protein